jgi:hypothetical protein
VRTTLRLRVGGLTLAVSAEADGPRLQWPAVYRPFLTTRGADIAISAQWELPPVPADARTLFESGGAWSCLAVGNERWYTFRTQGPSRPPDRILRMKASLTRGTLHVARGKAARAAGFALAYPLDDLVFQHHLASRGAAVVHACGLLHEERALIFCGASGAGKSTTARLWKRHAPRTVVLSDDRIVLRVQRGRFWAFGTPWHGEGRFAAEGARPLAALFFLRQSRRNELRAISPADAAAQLLARSFPPPWDAQGVAGALTACADVAASTPAYELRFRRDAGAVAAVRDFMARFPSRRRTSPTR